MQRPEVQPPALSVELHKLQVEIRNGLTTPAEARMAVWEWNGYPLLRPPRTLHGNLFGNSTHVLS